MEGRATASRLGFAACAILICTFAAQQFWRAAHNTTESHDRNIHIRIMSKLREGADMSGKMPHGKDLASARRQDPLATSALFILYSWNYDLLRTALQAYVAAGWGPRIIVIDNSSDKRILHDSPVNALVGDVIATRPSKLSFSQLQNFIAEVAIERNHTHYFWGHADVAVMASNATAMHSAEVLGCMDRIMEQEPDWGLIFFAHEGINCKDHFQATRTELAKKVQYDPFITVYISDCDYYPRVMADGYKLVSYTDFCPGLNLKSFDLRRPVELPVGDYERMREVLAAEEHTEVNRNEWKILAWGEGESFGWDNWETASLTYFKHKWNLTDEYQGYFCPDLTVLGGVTDLGRPLYRKPWQAAPGSPQMEVPAAPWCTRPAGAVPPAHAVG